MGRSYVLVEGRGEIGAVENLVAHLARDLHLPEVPWRVRGRCNALKQRAKLVEHCERLREVGDCDRALVLQDAEDVCPRDVGPAMAGWIADLGLGFPVAVALFYREYETLFLPCLHVLAGQRLRGAHNIDLMPLAPEAYFTGDPEAVRDAKKVINRFLPRTHPYRPTTHQLVLTRLLDFATLRAAGLPCFGTLERALDFLLTTTGPGVYPRP